MRHTKNRSSVLRAAQKCAVLAVVAVSISACAIYPEAPGPEPVAYGGPYSYNEYPGYYYGGPAVNVGFYGDRHGPYGYHHWR